MALVIRSFLKNVVYNDGIASLLLITLITQPTAFRSYNRGVTSFPFSSGGLCRYFNVKYGHFGLDLIVDEVEMTAFLFEERPTVIQRFTPKSNTFRLLDVFDITSTLIQQL